MINTLSEWTRTQEASFFLGFILGALMLALLTVVFRALKPDGVRALKLPEDWNVLDAWEYRQDVERRLDRAAAAAGTKWGSLKEVGILDEMFLEANRLWILAVERSIQSANAGKPLDTTDSPCGAPTTKTKTEVEFREERQHQK